MSRRASTRSIDARSDYADDDDDKKAREKDDQEVLEYVNTRLKRVMSIGSKSTGDDSIDTDDEFEAQLDEGKSGF